MEPSALARCEPSPPPRVAPEPDFVVIKHPAPQPAAPAVPLQDEPSEQWPKLIMEPIPHPMAGKNARSVLTKEAWRKVRDIVLEEHGWACAVCRRFKRKGLHCHEVWDFKWLVRDSKPVPVMQLVGLQALCRLCHGAKHIGCSRQKKYLGKVKDHLRQDYGMDDEDLDRIESDFYQKAESLKTTIPRELDLTYLNHEKFDEVHLMMNRMFSTNELGNCRPTSFDS